MDISTNRCLSLPIGGMRGVIQSTFLINFCQRSGIPENQLYKIFNIIGGASIGGIAACFYASGGTPTDFRSKLIEQGKKTFSVGFPGFKGQAGYGTWSLVFAGYPGYSSVYYNTYLQELCENALKKDDGTFLKMSDLKTNVVVPVYWYSQNGILKKKRICFSNISSEFDSILTGQDLYAKDVCMATSAAPFYFPPWIINGGIYEDGGLWMADPGFYILSLIKSINKHNLRSCLLTVGTGVSNIGYMPSDTVNPSPEPAPEPEINESMATKIKESLDLSLTGGKEFESHALSIYANKTLERMNLKYFRAQYSIDPQFHPNSSLDNASDEFIEYMIETTNLYFNNNIDKIDKFIDHLLL